jgi:murein DD-endopeptidase MepM/ murein hydrolase activator NlpD
VAYQPGRRGGTGGGDSGAAGIVIGVLFLCVLLGAFGVAWWTGAVDYAGWWLTNTTPPTVTLQVPTDAVRGTVTIEAVIGPEGRARPVDVLVDGRPLNAEQRVPIDTATLPDGQHQISVTAEDRSWRKNRTTASATLTTDNTPPKLTLESQPQQVLQGRTWVIRIRTNEPAAVDARLGGRDLPIEAGNGYGWAVVGFGPNADPTTLPVVVDGRDPAGNQTEASEALRVAAENFTRDEVDVPAQLAALLQSDIRADEDRALLPNYQKVTPEKLWEGRFLMPVQGQVITDFGTLRSYNNGPVVGHHGGADIAAGAGRNVIAPGRGRVVLIDQVRLRGNIVILDHGLGVFTTYAHLSAVDVQVGQTVERGQPFAKVGSTGLSTGPHLHWELWVGGQNVNPLEWTERDVP